MNPIRFHIFLLFVLGFFLGNDTTYAGELAIIDQTKTSWVIPNHKEPPAASFVYNEADYSKNQKKTTATSLWFSVTSIQNINQWHKCVAVLRYKKFKKSVFVLRENRINFLSFIKRNAKEEPPLV